MEVYIIGKEVLGVMLLKVQIIFTIFYFVTLARAEKCPGFGQHVVIPPNYNKLVPDAHHTGNVSEVQFWFWIKQIKMVKEDRYNLEYKFDHNWFLTIF